MSSKARIGVKRRKGENIESLLNRFKGKVYNSGILLQYMENQYFTKPSEEKQKDLKKQKFSNS